MKRNILDSFKTFNARCDQYTNKYLGHNCTRCGDGNFPNLPEDPNCPECGGDGWVEGENTDIDCKRSLLEMEIPDKIEELKDILDDFIGNHFNPEDTQVQGRIDHTANCIRNMKNKLRAVQRARTDVAAAAKQYHVASLPAVLSMKEVKKMFPKNSEVEIKDEAFDEVRAKYRELPRATRTDISNPNRPLTIILSKFNTKMIVRGYEKDPLERKVLVKLILPEIRRGKRRGWFNYRKPKSLEIKLTYDKLEIVNKGTGRRAKNWFKNLFGKF